MTRDPDRPGLVHEGTVDRLSNPPGGIRRELEASLRVELLHSAHEPDVPLLDQIRDDDPGTGTVPPAGQLDHQP